MIVTIELFEALKTRFGEGEAKVIVKEIEKIENGSETKVEKTFEQKSQVFKDDIKSLKEYMDLAFSTKEDLANLRGELETKMAQMEARLTVRMFYFWMGQVAVMAGLLANFFHITKWRSSLFVNKQA